MRIAVDAMGGDRAPHNILEGVRLFREEDEHTDILLVGQAEQLEDAARDLNAQVVNAPSVVSMHEAPSTALKTKKDSSIAVSLALVKQGQADAALSMGNSGATVGFAWFSLGRLPNITKPAIVAPISTPKGVTLLLDVGATVDCRPIHLLHFALMGSVFSQLIFNVDQPRVGLLSIGEEESKGNELTLGAAPLLQQAPVHFIGNIEGTEVFSDKVDVIVCDGFIGNVILKFGEGLVEMFSRTLKMETDEVLGDDINLEHRMTLFRETIRRVDYTAFGGAQLLGVGGHCLIGHGRSGPRAVANGIRASREAAEKCPISALSEALENAGASE